MRIGEIQLRKTRNAIEKNGEKMTNFAFKMTNCAFKSMLFALKMMNLVFKMMTFAFKMIGQEGPRCHVVTGDGIPVFVKNDEFCIKNDGFCIENDRFCLHYN